MAEDDFKADDAADEKFKENFKWIALLLAAIGAAVFFTIPKLYTMARIKGWVPGAVITHKVITQKGVARARRLKEDDIYWASWANKELREEDARRVGEGIFGSPDGSKAWKLCVRVSPDAWQRMKVGDQIEVVNIPGNERAFHRDDTFIEPIEFVLDFVFLAVEVTVATLVLLLLVLQYRRRKALDRIRELLANHPDLPAAE